MKSAKILAVSFLFFVFSTFMPSCTSEELSRSTAEKLIKEIIPNDQIMAFTISDCEGGVQSKLEGIKILQSKGLLTYREGRFPCVFVNLTAEGKQYAVSDELVGISSGGDSKKYINVKVAKLAFGEIKGILQTKESNSAKVDFTLVRKDITPFGSNIFDLNGGAIEYSVVFTKYDDGWRVNK